jgi:hypothetical protein
MSTKHKNTSKPAEKNCCDVADQDCAVDQKRNDEQQYHGDGVPHDPQEQLKKRIDREDPDAGDIDEETRSDSAPFNKTYGKPK